MDETVFGNGKDAEMVSVAESSKGRKSLKAAGMLSDYSNPDLMEKERNAWKEAAIRKYSSSSIQ